jgi:hypothetical protein
MCGLQWNQVEATWSRLRPDFDDLVESWVVGSVT